ncbi:MAG: TadE/TadG family type IV pilus assembly protein [Planctomycetaceae bacterium]
MAQFSSVRKLLARIHKDERGAVTLETILIIGAIALPILIFILKYGWPRIRQYFYKGLTDLEGQTDKTTSGN